MNILSMFSAMLATAFLIGGVYCFTRNRKSQLNFFSFLVLILLGWWNFCYAFFFSAETAEIAERWHRLASIGWTGFVAATTYYFIVLTGLSNKMNKLWRQLVFYALPIVLLINNLFGSATSLEQGIVKIGWCNQWTYINIVNNIWLWLYMFCLTAYFGFSFILLFWWAAQVNHRLKKYMAIGFIALDALTIFAGFITDVLLPVSGHAIPPVANLCTAIFGAGYFFIIMRYDLFNVRRVVDDRNIIEHSMEALLVMDEESEILDANNACSELFEVETSQLIGKLADSYFDKQDYNELIANSLRAVDSVSGTEISLHTRTGNTKQIIVSGSIIRDRKHDYMGTVLSIRDITQLNELREQYKLLAYVDTLTGLPNRRKTFDYLKACEEKYHKNGKDFSILYMDLDHFKSVNDQYGHNVGDHFLCLVANRLKESLNSDIEFLGRLSGDEFIFVGFSADVSQIPNFVANIQEKFKQPFIMDEISITSGISLGEARFSDFLSIDNMVHYADTAMYEMKYSKCASN